VDNVDPVCLVERREHDLITYWSAIVIQPFRA
jgi:hypothetical protein